MVPTREWVKEWIKKRDALTSSVDFQKYFSQSEVGNVFVDVVRVGLCSVPSGELLVRDPIRYLKNRTELPYFVTAPVGKYPAELAMVSTNTGEKLCAAARLIFNYRPVVHFEQALIGKEEIRDFEGGYFGFFSDSGWGCICDEQVHQAFCNFAEEWQQRYPNKNFYEECLFPHLKEGYYNWQIPNTAYSFPVFCTGWGEGQYPVYWGQDEEGRVCQIIVWMMDLENQNNADDVWKAELPTDLLLREDGWFANICLKEWEGYFGQDDEYSLVIHTQSEKQAWTCCEQLLKQQYQLLDVIMTALIDRYPLMQLEYGHLMSENAPEMPNILDKNDFAELMYPQKIVMDVEKNTIAAAFSCTWDSEEGFGVIVQGEKVLRMGTANLV